MELRTQEGPKEREHSIMVGEKRERRTKSLGGSLAFRRPESGTNIDERRPTKCGEGCNGRSDKSTVAASSGEGRRNERESEVCGGHLGGWRENLSRHKKTGGKEIMVQTRKGVWKVVQRGELTY